LVQRARIVLAAADGQKNKQIASELGCTRRTGGIWRSRFVSSGIAGIERDAPRGGRPVPVRGQKEAAIIRKTTQETSPNATQWSVRSMAKAVGVSKDTVQRVWKDNGLQPHRTKSFKVSNDPHVVEKLVDDGTTTLFAAIELAEGRIITECMPRHRHQEWIRFLKNLVVDNYSAHKHLKVRNWLKRNKRFHMHFIPTSSSWLIIIERWFRDLTHNRIRNGVFESVAQLVDAIRRHVDHHHANPTFFVWSRRAEDILEKIARARKALDKAHLSESRH